MGSVGRRRPRTGSAPPRVDLDGYGNPTTTTITPNTANATDPVISAGVGAAGISVRERPAATDPGVVVAERRFDGRGTSVEKTLSTGDGAQARSGGTRELDLLGRTMRETDQDGATTTHRVHDRWVGRADRDRVRADHHQHGMTRSPGTLLRDGHDVPGRGRPCPPGTSMTRPPGR